MSTNAQRQPENEPNFHDEELKLRNEAWFDSFANTCSFNYTRDLLARDVDEMGTTIPSPMLNSHICLTGSSTSSQNKAPGTQAYALSHVSRIEAIHHHVTEVATSNESNPLSLSVDTSVYTAASSSSRTEIEAPEQHSYMQIPAASMNIVNSHFTKCNSDKGGYYRCDYEGCTDAIGKFRTEKSVSKHIRSVHLKEKRFKCITCDVYFTREPEASRHVNGKNNGKIYKCSFCTKMYSRSDQRNSHEKRCLKDKFQDTEV